MATEEEEENYHYRQIKCAMLSDPCSKIIICFNEFASSGPPNSAHYYLQFVKQDNGSVELNHQR